MITIFKRVISSLRYGQGTNGRIKPGFMKIRYVGILLGILGIALIGYFATIRLNVQRNQGSSVTEVKQQTFSDLTISQLFNSGKSEAPHLISQQPEPGQELPLNGVIKLGFDQAMDQSIADKALKILDSSGKMVKGHISWLDSKTIQFKPTQTFNSSTRYEVNLSTEIKNGQGLPLPEDITIQFSTPSDLVVSQVFPADGALDVSNQAVITVIFNRPIVPLVITEEQNNLPAPLVISPDISGQGEWINTSVYAYRPSGFLKGGQTYTIKIKAGLTSADGSLSLQKDVTWKFTTLAPSIASLKLQHGPENPENNYQNVFLDEYFTVDFRQPMDRTSTENALVLKSSTGENVPLITKWDQVSTQLIITPTMRLALGTNYSLNIDKGVKAEDGGSLKEGLAWNFTTLQFPAVQYSNPTNGSRQSNFSSEFQIKFKSPMNFQSVKDRILISPLPKEQVQWWYNDWDWSVHTYNLQPSTAYSIQLLAGMMDIYGNPIKTTQTIRFYTTANDPQAYLQMPYQPALFRSGDVNTKQEFYAAYRNIKTIQFELYKIDAQKFVSFQMGSLSQGEYRPPSQDLVWKYSERSEGGLNELVLKKIEFKLDDNRQLEPGFYFLGIISPEIYTKSPYDDTRILVVANANVTFKSTASEALIWLTDFSSGKPLQGINLDVLDNKFQVIGGGKTDADGLLSLNLPAPADSYAPRYVITDDNHVFGFSFSEWGSGASFYDFGSWGTYYSPPNQSMAYVYTDRPIYRPGQPVYYKGIVRIDDDLKYRLPDVGQVKVTIRSYENTVFEQTLSLSEFGSFSGVFQIDKEAALGNYTISASYPNIDKSLGEISFNVAEYRKPEFWMDTTVAPKEISVGDKFEVNLHAEYFSGGSVGNANVQWTLTADPYFFTPPEEYSTYSFSDYEGDTGPNMTPEIPGSEVIAEGQDKLDASGNLKMVLSGELKDRKMDRRLTFEANATDVSENQVSSRDSVIVHQSLDYVGVQPKSYVGEAGKQQTFEIVVVDWVGKAVANLPVDVSIVERRWHNVQEQDAQGNVVWKSTVEEIPVTTLSQIATNDKGMTTVDFTPPNGGVYKAKATIIDANNNQAIGSAYMWVAGEAFIPWRENNDRSFTLITDRKTYLPGDTAEVLIASPFQGQTYALVTVERGHILYHQVVLLTNNSTVYKLPITKDMAPNVFVSVVIIKGIDENHNRPDFKIGIIELKVDTSEQKVSVEIVPDHEKAQPGDKISYTIYTRDSKGNPVNAEVSLGVSDLATLSLVPPNSQPILDYFYSYRILNVWTSIPLVLSIEDYNALVKENLVQGEGAGGGGGKGGGELGVVEVREEFPDTAFWQALVVTGQEGKTSVDFTLPDNLTTWRADARAVTQDTLVGQSITDILTTKSLLVRPQTPRFFVAGDKAQVGAAVHNNTSKAFETTISLEATGVSLQDIPEQKINVPAQGQVYVTWNITVNSDAERVDMVFSAKAGEYSDASRPTLGTLDHQGIPVYHYEARETVGTSGIISEGGSKIEIISLPTTIGYSSGDLKVEIAPSLAAGMTSGLTYLEHYPYECVEQTISRFLPNVMTIHALNAAGISNPDLVSKLQGQVNTALQSLYSWQNPDGGWGWWGQQKSDPLTSAYVILGLVEAKNAGYDIDSSVLSHGKVYLQDQLLPIASLGERNLLNRQVFILYVLAQSGNPYTSYTTTIYSKRLDMSVYAQAFLAETLSKINPDDTRIKTLLSDLSSSAIVSATGTHWQEKEEDPWNWNTDTRTTAIVLSALSQINPDNPLVASSVRWLMSNRNNGHWSGTQETAWTLMALSRWMVASGEMQPNYQYTVVLNNKRLGDGEATPKTLQQTLDLRIDVADLMKDQANRLGFLRTEGKGNLYYTAFLELSLSVSEIKPLDNGIIVSRVYYSPNDLKHPVTSAKRGDLLLTRLTIIAPNDLHYVVVDDPLPAGVEAVDQSLLTSQQEGIPAQLGWNDLEKHGWGWWIFDHVELKDEKVVLSVEYLPAGTYEYTYLVRAITPGEFQTIPTVAQEFYFPEVYGRGEGGLFTVEP